MLHAKKALNALRAEAGRARVRCTTRYVTSGQPWQAILRTVRAAKCDAIVMASAAQRGDVVYTADVSDLAKLAGYFRAVRVLSIG